MIFNNYLAMQRIRELRSQPLTSELLLDLHRILTVGTLESREAAGRFRLATERIVVGDDYGEIFHTPPTAESDVAPQRGSARNAVSRRGRTTKDITRLTAITTTRGSAAAQIDGSTSADCE